MVVGTQVREADQAQRGALPMGESPTKPDTKSGTKVPALTPMEKIDMMQDPAHTADIRALEEAYAERVNMAVAEDRYDLVDELAADFEAERERLQQVA